MSGLSEGWVTTTLSEVASWGSGGTPSRSNPNYYGGGIPWLKTGELGQRFVSSTEETISEEGLKNSSAKLFPAGSVAIAMYGATIGKTSILGIDASTNQACAVGIPNTELTSKEYLYHYLCSQKEAFVEAGKGGAQPNISQSVIKDWYVPLAPLPEQKRIADKLDVVLARVDACRDRLDRIPAILKRFRQSALAAATSGKLTEDWRADQVARMQPQAESGNTARDSAQSHYVVTIAPDSATLHPGYEALETGFPKTWSICQIKDAGRVQLGRQRSPKFHAGENMRPYLRVQNIFEDRLDLSDVMEMDFPGQDIERYQLHPGDILLNEGQSPEYLGRPAMYRGEIPGACFTNTLIRFQAYSHVIADFALLVFRHHMHSGRYRSEGTITTNIAHLGAGRFSNVEFPLPPINEQTEIVRRAESLFAYADRLEARHQAARAQVEKLTPATLAKAFRGELVRQDANDEPASVLLQRIQAEKAAQAVATKLHKPQKTKGKPALAETNVIPFPARIGNISATDLHAGILARAYQHHEQNPKHLIHFGHVKAEKIAHLVEAHLGIDLERMPVKAAAGPNDYPHLKKVESRAQKANWFVVRQQKADGAYVFHKERGFDALLGKTAEALGERATEVDTLINLLLPLNTRQAEIVATLYAAWNNLLLLGRSPCDEDIVCEARENWHASKLGIARDKFFKGLEWMRKQGLVPLGRGRYVDAK